MRYQRVFAIDDFEAYIAPMIEKWRAQCKPDLDAHREGYKNLEFDRLFDQVTLGKEPDSDLRASHQRRLKREALKDFRIALSSKKYTIRTAASFEELNKLTRDVAEGVKGIGRLMVYDTSLRFGFHRDLFPEEVHLQQGAFDGARRFFERKGADMSFRQGSALPMDSFSPLNANLEPYEIENFLCTMKGVLEGGKEPSSCSPTEARPSQC